MTDNEERAAAWEILRVVFATASDEDFFRLENAFAGAWGVPAPPLETDVSASAWLPVYRAIAKSVGVSWQPAWSAGLQRHDSLHRSFPERLTSHLKQLRERVVELAEDQGWYPQLLELGVNFARLSGEHELNYEELRSLVVPALAALDAAPLKDCPNRETWPPDFLPVLCAARIPEPLAIAVAAMELTDRGMLWGICKNLCQPDRGTEWWDSVKQFRASLRRRVLSDSPPRQLRYEANKPAESLLEAALAPINLILDETPQRKDFEQLDTEFNVDSDSSYVRLKACVRACPQPEVLQWTVEELASVKPKYALWLLKPLITARRWDLLHHLLKGLYSGNSADKPDYLSGFDFPQEPQPSVASQQIHWRQRLADILGMGPNEGLIYRLPELVRQRLDGTLFEDVQIREQKEAIRLAAEWPREVRDLFEQPDTHKAELIRTLLVVALLTDRDNAAHVAEEFVRTDDKLEEQLGPELLWVGRAVAPALLREDRIARVARSGRDAYAMSDLGGWEPETLHVLVGLKKWDALGLHLRSCAASNPEGTHKDPLLQWYRACQSLSLDEQLVCLQIYHDLAPPLLAARREMPAPSSEVAGAFRPVRKVSNTLEYDSHSLPKPIANAVRAGRFDVARAWFRAVLIEAEYGPNLRDEIACLETLCACAGAWLVLEKDADLWAYWVDFVRAVSDEFETRSIWRAMFRGTGMCLGERLGADLDRWTISSDYRARLALGEALAEYGDPNDARAFFGRIVRESRHPWLVSLRACEAFLYRSEPSSPRHESLAREFVALAWDTGQGKRELEDPKFLATVTERAVETRCEPVLAGVVQTFGGESPRAAALSRIALDVFLTRIKRDEPAPALWRFTDLIHQDAIQRFVLTLVEEAISSGLPAEDLGRYDHDWLDESVGQGLGWFDALIRQLLDEDTPAELLSWVGTWVTRIPPERDVEGKICERVADWLGKTTVLPTLMHPLFDFAIASLKKFRGRATQFVELATGLLKAHYRMEECLETVDEWLKTESHYKQWALKQMAITCAREYPDSGVAERYLEQLTSDDKALAEDDIAEARKSPAVQRLARLLSAPQTTDVVERLLQLVEGMMSDMAQLDDVALRALGSVVARLILDTSRLDDRIARELGSLLQPSEYARLVEDSSLLRDLRA